MTKALSFMMATMISVLAFGCANEIVKFDEPRDVGLHLQSYFASDIVSVEVDGVEVYRDTVSTDPTLGLADMATLPFTRSRQTVRVRVTDGPSAELTVRARKDKTVVVRYDREASTLRLATTTQRLFYY